MYSINANLFKHSYCEKTEKIIFQSKLNVYFNDSDAQFERKIKLIFCYCLNNNI